MLNFDCWLFFRSFFIFCWYIEFLTLADLWIFWENNVLNALFGIHDMFWSPSDLLWVRIIRFDCLIDVWLLPFYHSLNLLFWIWICCLWTFLGKIGFWEKLIRIGHLIYYWRCRIWSESQRLFLEFWQVVLWVCIIAKAVIIILYLAITASISSNNESLLSFGYNHLKKLTFDISSSMIFANQSIYNSKFVRNIVIMLDNLAIDKRILLIVRKDWFFPIRCKLGLWIVRWIQIFDLSYASIWNIIEYIFVYLNILPLWIRNFTLWICFLKLF